MHVTCLVRWEFLFEKKPAIQAGFFWFKEPEETSGSSSEQYFNWSQMYLHPLPKGQPEKVRPGPPGLDNR
jgi:hypothetical protein